MPAAADIEEEPDEQDELEVTCAGELGLKITTYKEWRCSYRRGCPEDCHSQEAKVLTQTFKKRSQLTHHRIRSGLSSRHPSFDKPADGPGFKRKALKDKARNRLLRVPD